MTSDSVNRNYLITAWTNFVFGGSFQETDLHYNPDVPKKSSHPISFYNPLVYCTGNTLASAVNITWTGY